jgi:Fe2+ transport system protein FeoA
MSQNILALDSLLIPESTVKAVTSLAELKIGTRARVISVDGANSVSKRLMEMGVVPGAPIKIIKNAPLGDPMEIRIRSYNLALRKSEAQTIRVIGDE